MLHSVLEAEREIGVAGAAPLALAVVVPVLNEAANVRPLLASLEQVLGGLAWEALFVDDGSTDGTLDLLRAIARVDRRVRVIERVGRRGLASAVIEGMLASAAPVLAVIDGDRQHDERLLPELHGAILRGADVAVASRYMPDGGLGDWSERRAAASRLATRAARATLGTPLSDPMSGFFAISRTALAAALPRLSGSGFKLLLDILASSPTNLAVVELPYRFRARTAGASKLDLRIMLDYGVLLLDKTIGRWLPTRLILFLGVGALGLVPHLVALGLLLRLGASFAVAQAVAASVAMTCNFTLNNLVTYRDRRLRGLRFLLGLLSFYGVCSVGIAANVGIGALVAGAGERWWAAGVAGAAVGALWNFAASSFVTWRR